LVESDEEQLEVLKQWWDENGTTLMVTIVLALGASFGYKAWENNVQEQGETASAIYEDLLVATQFIDPESDDETMSLTATSLADSLKNEYGSTTYATFAAMHLAKVAVNNGDARGAQAELEWALGQVTESHLETIIRMRLARVLIMKGDATAAMAVIINHQPAQGQVASLAEVKGDVFSAMGSMESARQSYQIALENLDDEMEKPILEIKLADIPLVATDPDEVGEELGETSSDNEDGDA